MSTAISSGDRRFRGRSRSSGDLQKVPLKGLFADGVWQCNCHPRLPAEHFQTKNGGKNHGRWFYTCQKPQQKRCNFFLWDDQAKPREAKAVLNNSRSEPEQTAPPGPIFKVPPNCVEQDPKTASKASDNTNIDICPPPTGSSTSNVPYELYGDIPTINHNVTSPSGPGKSSNTQSTDTQSTESAIDPEDLYDWPSSDEDTIAKAADRVSMPPPPETPRKTHKTSALATPGKRRYDEMAYPTPSADDDVFTTPLSNPVARSLFTSSSSPVQTSTPGLATPSPTPSRFRAAVPTDSELSADIVSSLRSSDVSLTDNAITLIQAICHKFTAQTQGIAKGRDISRAAIKGKDEKILELQGKIAALEQERDTNRNVIRCLRNDAAAGAEKTKGRGRWKGSGKG